MKNIIYLLLIIATATSTLAAGKKAKRLDTRAAAHKKTILRKKVAELRGHELGTTHVAKPGESHEKCTARLHKELGDEIDNGACVNAILTEGGRQIIHIACLTGSTELLEKALRAGANIHAKTANGNTPLHHAAWQGHSKLVDLLIERGADPKKQNYAGSTPYEMVGAQLCLPSAQKPWEDGKSAFDAYDPYKKKDPAEEKVAYEEWLNQEHTHYLHQQPSPETIEGITLSACAIDCQGNIGVPRPSETAPATPAPEVPATTQEEDILSYFLK